MKKWVKKIMAVALVVSMGAAVAGCGKVERSADGKPQMPEQEVAARGRYVETELDVPEELSNAGLSNFCIGENGRMDFLTPIYRESGNPVGYHYQYDGSEWVKQDIAWILEYLEQESMRLRDIFCTQDGTYYLVGRNLEAQYRLYRGTAQGVWEELFENEFTSFSQAGTETRAFVPREIEVNQQGDILLIDSETAMLYRQDGTFVCSMEEDAMDSKSRISTRIFNSEEYITFLNGEIVRYDLTNGEITETIPCEGQAVGEEGNGIIAADGNGGIFLAGRSGLSHIKKGASLWEQMIEGNMTTMGMQNLYLAGWVPGSDNDFYGVFQGEFSQNVKLFHYTYDAEIAAVPPITLTVYSLYDVASVRQAASLMQKINPDVQVEYRVAAKEGEDSVQEDIIRSLNMELLNGKGADVLLLDGLPADTYQEKGILMDMSGLFAELQEKRPLLPFVVENVTEADGNIYRMPIRLSFPAAMGEPEALKALESLEGMAGYQGNLPLLPTNNYGNILRLVANIRYEELWGSGNELPEEEVLIRYLETVKAIGESNGAKTELSKEELSETGDIKDYGNQATVRGLADHPVGYDGEIAAATVMEFHSVYDSTLPWAAAEKRPGKGPKALNGSYFPLAVVAINQATGQKEVAEEFVRLLYSDEIQDIEFFQSKQDGFPVQIHALESWKGLERSVNIGTGWEDGYFLMGKWPKQEQREQLVRMVTSLTTPVTVDQTMMQMIVDGAKGYLDGKETVQNAAANIYRKISLYHAE